MGRRFDRVFPDKAGHKTVSVGNRGKHAVSRMSGA